MRTIWPKIFAKLNYFATMSQMCVSYSAVPYSAYVFKMFTSFICTAISKDLLWNSVFIRIKIINYL